MVRIKLCGFTRKEDIKKAVSLRADYLGIILYSKSPRYVEMDRAVKLLEAVKGPKSVAVMVNPTLEEAREALGRGFELIQLHGEESLDFAMDIGI